MILGIWLLMVLAEISRNYYVIEIKKKNPDHNLYFAARAFIGLVFWAVSPWIQPEMRNDQWWAQLIMMFFTFGCLFDWGLNITRRRPYWYLGGKSWFDSWMKSSGLGAFGWFWWRLALAAGSLTLFWRGLRALSEYPGPDFNFFL